MTGCVDDSAEGPTLSADKPLQIQAESSGMTTTVELDGSSVVRGDNAFWVRLSDADATLTGVHALMPAHGHDTAPATIAPSDRGYHVTGLQLFMPGRWEVTLELEVGAMLDRALFSLDVP